MYKVFVNENPLMLTENKNFSTVIEKVPFGEVRIMEIVERLFSNDLGGICLLCNDLEEDWEKFQNCFKLHNAAGGKVLNFNKEVLFIYRFDKWDLPKGKLKKKEDIQEGAIREVEEECGIDKLVIREQLETTYHIFRRNSKVILKKTYWFLMESDFKGTLVPQLEEGITQAVFKNREQTKQALNNTYENIKLLF